MDQVLFGDNFINIEKHLFPKDLYQLVQVCQQFRKIITTERIKQHTISEIMSVLQRSLGYGYNDFVEIMRKMNISIVGLFIAQCFLGEVCQNSIIEMIATRMEDQIPPPDGSSPEYDIFMKFVRDKFHERYEECNIMNTITRTNKNHIVQLIPKMFAINGSVMRLCSLYSPIHNVEDYVHNYTNFSFNKNMYSFATNELYIHNMRGIFSKRTALSIPIHDVDEFPFAYKQGFRFYKPETNKLLSEYDLLCSSFDVIRISNRNPIQNVTNVGIYAIRGDVIQQLIINQAVTIFNVIDISMPDKHKRFWIHECLSKNCGVRLLYPGQNHLHGDYEDDNVNSETFRRIVLIFDN